MTTNTSHFTPKQLKSHALLVRGFNEELREKEFQLKYSVKVTFLELYNEEITDLLAPDDLSKLVLEDKQKKQLPLMEDGKGGVLVRGLEEEIVENTKVYASREKNGVYVPKERYYQEESERKAMADHIERMGVTIENHQKQIEELQSKYDLQIEQCTDLSKKLDATQKDLDQTSKLLANAKEELKESQHCIKEQDFIISEQKNSENALVHQACVLRAYLEKSLKDNASLFLKIAREDKLNSDNRSTLDNFRADLSKQLDTLCNLLPGSISRQCKYLQSVENLCNSFLLAHNTVNFSTICWLHKAGSNAALDELSAIASSNSHSIGEFLAAEDVEMNSVFVDLQQSLSNHQREMVDLARELRQVCICNLRFPISTSKKEVAVQPVPLRMKHRKNSSESLHGFIEKLDEESKRLGSHATKVDEVQTKCITDFSRAYEEQSRTDAQKLIADVITLVSDCMHSHKEMVDARLGDLNDSVIGNKMFLDGYVSTMDGITSDLKRKSKHCRMELLIQNGANTGDAALKRWQSSKQVLLDMGSQHASTIALHARSISESSELHDAEIESARVTVEKDAEESCNDIIRCFDDHWSEQERASVSEISATARAHSETVDDLKRDHSEHAACIQQHATDTFIQKYMDYEPTELIPVRCEPVIPSKSTIVESLRTMPMETLREEFRENHSFIVGKEVKIQAPRSPLSQIN
ncbi:hypothetical protein SASPL_102133 [Salvia splendens]|uniref:Kinesin motor domain-containing protein n=1 Tax=Salvia splendens TaxID=180675 RepID=A0A8X8YVS0_SALSN|nr:hypothetical protein SASPL_102133 [Salvia splendens]